MPYAATIGFFDGVHLGHHFLFQQLREEATKRDLQTMAVTFGEHPALTLGRPAPALITPPHEKQQLLEQEVERVETLRFTTALAALSAREFMQLLRDDYDVKMLLIGYDHHFGRPQKGDGYELYATYGEELGIEVVQALPAPPPTISTSWGQRQGKDITPSSSSVRQALKDGDIRVANRLLGRRYTLSGRVVSGHQVGHTLGFPTANIAPISTRQLIPASGVYAAWIITEEGQRWQGAINIGQRPTLDNGDEVSIECHLLNYYGDLYGASLTIEFVERLRPEQRFETLENLKTQISSDIILIKQILNNTK